MRRKTTNTTPVISKTFARRIRRKLSRAEAEAIDR